MWNVCGLKPNPYMYNSMSILTELSSRGFKQFCILFESLNEWKLMINIRHIENKLINQIHIQ